MAGCRYVVESGGREALYDLDQDPDAYRDVAGDPGHAEVLGQARHELLTRLIEQEPTLPRVWAY